MAKAFEQIEVRVERLERELAMLKASMAKKSGAPWYRQIVGDFAEDEAYAEFVRLGRLVRTGKLKS